MTFPLKSGLAALLVAAVGFGAPSKGDGQPSEEAIRKGANQALGAMQKSMAGMLNAPCSSCHHGMVPLFAMSMARERGVAVDEALMRKVAARTYRFLTNVDRAIQGSQFVDPAVEGAELLGFAKAQGVAPSVTTALHARRMARGQREDGRWVSFDSRPPASASVFMATALSAKAVLDYAPEVAEGPVAKAREFLLRNAPVSVEDAAFRVLGLQWTKASASEVRRAAEDLAAMQDAQTGGWPQAKGREADAYATGQAVAVLTLAGVGAEQAKRGVAFLLASQKADGTWQVKTRLHEVAPISPPYMETGFPYGKDQIISMMGTTWAVLGLALQLPRVEGVGPVAELTEVRPVDVPAWVAEAAWGDLSRVEDVNAATATGGSTVLMAASGDVERVRALLARGANVRARAKSGYTAMMAAAAWRGSAPVLRLLASKGADAKPGEKVEFHANPLVYASMNGDVEAVRVLLDQGAVAKQGMVMQGFVPMSPMTAAILTGAVDVVREYLARGFDANAVEDVPLLTLAVIGNRPEVAKVLLEAGAKADAVDKYKWTAAQHAKAIERDVDEMSAVLAGGGESARR